MVNTIYRDFFPADPIEAGRFNGFCGAGLTPGGVDVNFSLPWSVGFGLYGRGG